MSRVSPLPFRKLDRALRAHGFVAIRQRGSHVFYKHADGRTTLVPNHPGRDVPPGLVRKIIADTQLSADEFR